MIKERKMIKLFLNFKKQNQAGFTLVELLIYIAIFSIFSIFLVSILSTFTRIQVRQVGVNEVNHQINFVSTVIQSMVKKSSLINMPDGIVTSTINLRMASSTLDPTIIYASGTAIYMVQGNNSPTMLTDSNVNVTNFSAIKYPTSGGSYIVQVNLSLTYNNPNPASQFSQSLQFAVSRISAATFDSPLYPASSTSLDLGSVSTPWGNGFLSGNLNVGGTIYSGSGSPGNTALKANGNIGFANSSQGLILVAPGGSCFLVGVNASGTLVTSAATCP
jgi:prepilin-type N-terminal cleavage/methylation domain-containing protein